MMFLKYIDRFLLIAEQIFSSGKKISITFLNGTKKSAHLGLHKFYQNIEKGLQTVLKALT